MALRGGEEFRVVRDSLAGGIPLLFHRRLAVGVALQDGGSGGHRTTTTETGELSSV